MSAEINLENLSTYRYIRPLRVVNIDIFRDYKTGMLNKIFRKDWQSNNVQVIYILNYNCKS